MPIFFYAKRPEGFLDFQPEKLTAKSLEDVLTKPESVLEQVAPEERWDFYYGLAQTSEPRRADPKDENGKIKRGAWARANWKRQEALAWDLDGINEKDRGTPQAYQDIVARVLKVDPLHMTVIASGHGFHFILFLEQPITDHEFFNKHRVFYRATLDEIEKQIQAAGLTGKADPAVFDHNRVLRMPATENRKREPYAICRIIQVSTHKHPLSLQAIAGLPQVGENDAVAPEDYRQRRLDVKGIQEECLVLKSTREEPQLVKEPLGYAALSVLGRLDTSHAIAREYYKRWTSSTSLMQSDPDRKIEQALANSGPTTCAKFSTLSPKCGACAWNGKIRSPIQIQGANFIETEEDGFWIVNRDREGNVRSRTPAYADLLRKFVTERKYIYDTKGGDIYSYNGKFYEAIAEDMIRGFAEETMRPAPAAGGNTIRSEFLGKVKANRQWGERDVLRFFYTSTHGKLNLQNGVLDIRSKIMAPHSPDIGFRYCLPYSFDPSAKAPSFEGFLDDVTLKRDSIRQTLLEFMGYVLWPGYEDHMFLWLTGAGRNGKSTYMDLIREMVGEENASSLLVDAMVDDQYSIAELDHKLVNLSEESDIQKLPRKFLGLLKLLSAGGAVSANRKYASHLPMRNTAKMVFASNELPILDGVQDAIKSRMVIVPFDLRLEDHFTGVSRIRHELPAELKSELPGILNLALAGLERALARKPLKIFRGEEAQETLRQVIHDSDTVEKWMYNCVELDPTGERFIPSKEIYAHYSGYAGEHRLEEKWFFRRFKNKLGNRLIPHRTEIARGWRGIKITGETDVEY